MDSGSSLAPSYVATPIVVDIKDCPHPEFKQCRQITKVGDSIDAFSRVPDEDLYVEDMRAYIHYTLEDLGLSKIKSMYMSTLLNKDGLIKLEFQIMKDQGFTNIMEISKFEDEMIQYVLS